MNAHTLDEAGSPGWRELVESKLADVLRGLWRRGRLARVGQGRYGLPGYNATGRPA